MRNLPDLFTIEQNTPEISFREGQVLCKVCVLNNSPLSFEAKRMAMKDPQ